jgi:hypothetical protein
MGTAEVVGLVVSVITSGVLIAWRLGCMSQAIKALEKRLDEVVKREGGLRCDKHEARLMVVEDRLCRIEEG